MCVELFRSRWVYISTTSSCTRLTGCLMCGETLAVHAGAFREKPDTTAVQDQWRRHFTESVARLQQGRGKA